jgi:hypothetical protein
MFWKRIPLPSSTFAGFYSTAKAKVKVLQNYFAGDGEMTMKAKTTVLFLNESVQKLATAHPKLDKRVHKNPAWRATMNY